MSLPPFPTVTLPVVMCAHIEGYRMSQVAQETHHSPSPLSCAEVSITLHLLGVCCVTPYPTVPRSRRRRSDLIEDVKRATAPHVPVTQ